MCITKALSLGHGMHDRIIWLIFTGGVTIMCAHYNITKLVLITYWLSLVVVGLCFLELKFCHKFQKYMLVRLNLQYRLLWQIYFDLL